MADALPKPDPTRVARLLDDLARPAVAEAEILRMGANAVPPLLEYLEGAPQSVPDGKRLAAQFLGVIGGEDAIRGLCRFMTGPNPTGIDPILALSEGVARNEAAAQLATLCGSEAAPDLLRAYRRHHLPAAAQVIGRFQLLEGVPDLIEALESDLDAEPAFEALSRFGPAADEGLRKALLAPRRNPNGAETRPSRQRRMRLAVLLGVPGRQASMAGLRQVLAEGHPALRAASAVAILRMDPGSCGGPCLAALLEGCLSPDAWLQARSREAAAGVGPEALGPACHLLRSGSTQDLYGRVSPLSLEARAWLATWVLRRLRTREDLDRLNGSVGPVVLAAGLTQGGSDLSRVVAGLARHPDPRVRAALSRVFRCWSDLASIEGLIRLLGDPSRAVRAEARRQVSLLLRSDPTVFWRSWPGLRASSGWRARLAVGWLRAWHPGGHPSPPA